jgi:hypothetical protein
MCKKKSSLVRRTFGAKDEIPFESAAASLRVNFSSGNF